MLFDRSPSKRRLEIEDDLIVAAFTDATFIRGDPKVMDLDISNPSPDPFHEESSLAREVVYATEDLGYEFAYDAQYGWTLSLG
jgi:hypothetical protein